MLGENVLSKLGIAGLAIAGAFWYYNHKASQFKPIKPRWKGLTMEQQNIRKQRLTTEKQRKQNIINTASALGIGAGSFYNLYQWYKTRPDYATEEIDRALQLKVDDLKAQTALHDLQESISANDWANWKEYIKNRPTFSMEDLKTNVFPLNDKIPKDYHLFPRTPKPNNFYYKDDILDKFADLPSKDFKLKSEGSFEIPEKFSDTTFGTPKSFDFDSEMSDIMGEEYSSVDSFLDQIQHNLPQLETDFMTHTATPEVQELMDYIEANAPPESEETAPDVLVAIDRIKESANAGTLEDDVIDIFSKTKIQMGEFIDVIKGLIGEISEEDALLAIMALV